MVKNPRPLNISTVASTFSEVVDEGRRLLLSHLTGAGRSFLCCAVFFCKSDLSNDGLCLNL